MRTDKRGPFLSILLGIYVILIGIGLPVVVRDRYFDLLSTKYYFYLVCTILIIALSFIYFITAERKSVLLYFKGLSIKDIIKRMTVADCSVLIFLLAAAVSTLFSDYLYESFWGNEGRLTGFFLLSLYVLSYFFVSRFWIYRSYYIDGMLAAGIFVCVFGITDYFQMDIFHFRVNVLVEQKNIFTSTIGNINTYTAYVGMIMAISSVLFAASGGKRKIYYYFCMIISFFAIIMGVSDNAYISLAALFGFLPLYLFSDKSGIRRYLVILVTFFSAVQITAWINVYFSDVVIGTDGVFNIIAESEVLLYLIVGLWSLVGLWYMVEHKNNLKLESKEYGKRFQYMWLILILLIILLMMYALYDCNVSGNAQRYGLFGTYLVFNDEWGTHRGYIWRNAIERFSEFSLWKKLVGFGPETFGILLRYKTYNNPYGETFDAAHNEYLQLLLTIGIIGVTSYIVFLLSYIKKCFGCRNKNPYMIAIVYGVICYSTQAFVNLSVPVVAPVFWLLLGMGTALSIKNNGEE